MVALSSTKPNSIRYLKKLTGKEHTRHYSKIDYSVINSTLYHLTEKKKNESTWKLNFHYWYHTNELPSVVMFCWDVTGLWLRVWWFCGIATFLPMAICHQHIRRQLTNWPLFFTTIHRVEILIEWSKIRNFYKNGLKLFNGHNNYAGATILGWPTDLVVYIGTPTKLRFRVHI